MSEVLRVSDHKIYNIIQTYDKTDIQHKTDKHWDGMFEERSYLTLVESLILEKSSLKFKKRLILTTKDIIYVTD